MNRAPFRQSGAIAAAYEQHVRAVCDGDFPDGLQLRGRLDPSRWVLEWSFARWVGTAFGVADRIWRQIALSNVLVLASVVWQDDLEDGELAAADPARARDVGESLFEAAMQPYRTLLPAHSPFWGAQKHWMSVWRAATTRAAIQVTAADGRSERFEPAALAVRGAPLKIPALALCLLANRFEAFPTFEACIDRTMTGLVLYDHFADWREDIAHSRWNAFVEFTVACRPARPGSPTFADVQGVMLTHPLVRDYFTLIDRELLAGAELAAEVGVRDLALHLHGLARGLQDEGQSISNRYVSLGDQARQLIFGRQTATVTN